jgi:hypothetical protein
MLYRFAQTTAGTQIYMAPELFNNQPYNKAADMWSYGCVLMEIMSPLDNKLQYMQLLLKGEEAYHREIVQRLEDCGYSFEIASLVTNCLKREPMERHTISEIIHMLNELRDDSIDNIIVSEAIEAEEYVIAIPTAQIDIYEQLEDNVTYQINVTDMQFKHLLDYVDVFLHILGYCDIHELLMIGFTSKFMNRYIFRPGSKTSNTTSTSDIIFKELCINSIDVKRNQRLTPASKDKIINRIIEWKETKLNCASWYLFYKYHLKQRFDPEYAFRTPSMIRVYNRGELVTYDSAGTYWEAVTSQYAMTFGHIYRWRVNVLRADGRPNRVHLMMGCTAIDKQKKREAKYGYSPAFNKESDGMGFAFQDWSIRKGVQMLPEYNTPKRNLQPGDSVYFKFDYRSANRKLKVYLNGSFLAETISRRPRNYLPIYYPTICLFKNIELSIDAVF